MSEFAAYLAIGISQGLVYGLLALGIVLVYKGSRVLNFAHPYFGLVCAFLAWWLTSVASFPPFSWLPLAEGSKPRFVLSAFVALILIALYGAGVEHGVMRRLRGAPRLVNLVATIALAQGALGLTLLLFNRTDQQASTFRSLPVLLGNGVSFEVGERVITPAEIQIMIVVPIICIVSVLFFTRTKFGVAVRAAAENVETARLLGISADRVSQFVWVTGAVLAGIAGILITQKSGSLDIGSLSTGFLVRGLAAALVGGLTSLPGAVVGGLIVGVAESISAWLFDNEPGIPETIMFAVVIAFLVFRPGGIFGQREDTEDKVAFVPTLRDLPARLRNTAAARGVRTLGYVAAIGVTGIAFVSGSETNGILTEGVIFAMVGVSLTVLMGWSGQISLGQWGLAGVGAFAFANFVTRSNLPFFLSLLLTVVVGMLVSLLIGLPALRIRGMYLAVATLAFNLAAEFYLFKSRAIAQSTAGIIVDPPKLGPWELDDPSRKPLFFFSVVMLLLVMLVCRSLARGRTGRGFYALRENEKAAATLGVGLTKYKLLAFAISGGIAALAGALYALQLERAQSLTWTTATSLVIISVVMIGGIGSLSGSVFGALLVVSLPKLIKFDNPWIVPIGTGIALLIVILRARGGIAGAVQWVRGSMVEAIDEMSQAPPPAPAPPAPAPGSGS